VTGRPSTPDVVAHQVGELVRVMERLCGDLADMREEQAAREALVRAREEARVEREATRAQHDTERHKAIDARFAELVKSGDALSDRIKPLESAHSASGWLRTGLAVAGGALVTGVVVALLRVLGVH
jgi:hypothetical protein